MSFFKWVSPLALILLMAISLPAQTNVKTPKTKAAEPGSWVKSSPAFAEVILQKTELQAELESLLVSYTEEFPKIKELRFELEAISKEINRLAAIRAEESSKLTLALGKLMVKKVELETDFWGLQAKYGDDHPEVKRAKRKVEIYENSIREIIQ